MNLPNTKLHKINEFLYIYMNIETPFSFSFFETNGKEMHCEKGAKQQTWAKGGKSLNTLPPN
jgi:hypothetical protein